MYFEHFRDDQMKKKLRRAPTVRLPDRHIEKRTRVRIICISVRKRVDDGTQHLRNVRSIYF